MGLIGLASLITTLQLAFFTAASAFQCELETDVGLSGFQNGPGRDATYFDTAQGIVDNPAYSSEYRPYSFTCCQDPLGIVTGFKMTHRNAFDEYTYLTTDCTGWSCSSCNEPVVLSDLFSSGRLTGIKFFQNGDDKLINISIAWYNQTQAAQSVCQPPTTGEPFESSRDVVVPLVGFRGYYDKSAAKFEQILTVENACTLHPLMFELRTDDQSEEVSSSFELKEMQIGNPKAENYGRTGALTPFGNFDYDVNPEVLQVQNVEFSAKSVKSARYGNTPAYIDVVDVQGTVPAFELEMTIDTSKHPTEPFADVLIIKATLEYSVTVVGGETFYGSVDVIRTHDIYFYAFNSRVDGLCMKREQVSQFSDSSYPTTLIGAKQDIWMFYPQAQLVEIQICKSGDPGLITGIILKWDTVSGSSVSSQCYGLCNFCFTNKQLDFQINSIHLGRWFQSADVLVPVFFDIVLEYNTIYRQLSDGIFLPSLPDLSAENAGYAQNFQKSWQSIPLADKGLLVDIDVEKYDDTDYLAVFSIYTNRCNQFPQTAEIQPIRNDFGFKTAYLSGPSFTYPPIGDPDYYDWLWSGLARRQLQTAQNPLVGDPENQGVVAGFLLEYQADPGFQDDDIVPTGESVSSVTGLFSVDNKLTLVVKATDSSLVTNDQSAYVGVAILRFSSPWITFELLEGTPDLWRVKRTCELPDFETQSLVFTLGKSTPLEGTTLEPVCWKSDVALSIQSGGGLFLEDQRVLDLLTQDPLAPNKYFFYTNNTEDNGKTFEVRQTAKVFAAGQLVATLTEVLYQITVRKDPCKTTQFVDQQINPMGVQLNSVNVKQTIPFFQNTASIDDGVPLYCGQQLYSLEFVEDGTAPAFMEIQGTDIVLMGISEEHLGEWQVDLVVTLEDYEGVTFKKPFLVKVSEEDISDDQGGQEKAINTPPVFKGYEDPLGNTAELPDWNVNVNEVAYFTFPEIRDQENDEVTTFVEPGSKLVQDCNCLKFNQETGELRLVATNELQGSLSLFEVFLDDGLEISYYFFYLKVSELYVPTEAPVKKSLEEELDEAFVEQYKFPGVVPPDDEDEFDDRQQGRQQSELDYCIPRFRKASREGDIQIVFNEPIEQIELSNSLIAAIVNSGSIQVQLISSGGFNDVSEQRGQDFKWTIKSIKGNEMVISIDFDSPEFISSATLYPDRLRVLFVSTDSFLRCQSNLFADQEDIVSAQVILERLRDAQGLNGNEEPKEDPFQQVNRKNGNRNRRALQENDKSAVPPNFQVLFAIPPQREQSGQSTPIVEAIEEAEDAVKTLVFSSIFVAIVFKFSLQNLWGGINALQLIAHLPMNNVLFPGNVYYVFDVLIQVVSFDLYAPADYIDFGFTETDPYSENFEWVGYETHNFIECLGSIVIFLFLIVLKNLLSLFFMLLGLIRITCCCKCCGKCRRSLIQSKDAFISSWIQFLLEVFFELLISSMVGLKLYGILNETGEEKSPADKFTLATTWLMTPLIFAFPIFVTWFTLFKARKLAKRDKLRQMIEMNDHLLGYYQETQSQKSVESIEIESNEQSNSVFESDDKRPPSLLLEQIKTRPAARTEQIGARRAMTFAPNLNSKFALELGGQIEEAAPEVPEAKVIKKPEAIAIKKSKTGVEILNDKNKLKVDKKRAKSLAIKENILRLSTAIHQNEFNNRRLTLQKQKTVLEKQKMSQAEQDEIDEEFEKYAPLFADLKTHHKSSLLFYEVHVVRRLLFVFAAYYLSEYPWIQVTSYLVQSKIMVAYLTGWKPFVDPVTNYIEIFNEYIVMIIGYHQMVLTGFVYDTYTKNTVGTSMIVFISLMIIVNVLLFTWQFIMELRLKCMRCLNQRKMKKQVKPRRIPQASQAADSQSNQSESVAPVAVSDIDISIRGDSSLLHPPGDSLLQPPGVQSGTHSSRFNIESSSMASLDFENENKKYGALRQAGHEVSQRLPAKDPFVEDPLIVFSESSDTDKDRSHLVVPTTRKKWDDMEKSRLIIEAIDKKLLVTKQDIGEPEEEEDRIEEEISEPDEVTQRYDRHHSRLPSQSPVQMIKKNRA